MCVKAGYKTAAEMAGDLVRIVWEVGKKNQIVQETLKGLELKLRY